MCGICVSGLSDIGSGGLYPRRSHRCPLSDDVSSELQDIIRKHWSSIRTNKTNGNLQSRYNFRLETLDTRTMHSQLRRIFWDQTSRFKINFSYAFILKNTRTGRLRYFHSSNNLRGRRYLEERHLITNIQDYEDFLEQKDVLQYAINNGRNSSYIVTNVPVKLLSNVCIREEYIILHNPSFNNWKK